MTKYQGALFAILSVLGVSAAHATDGTSIGYRDLTASPIPRPQRPGMHPRGGDESWCDDSGGGLECGVSICREDEEDLESWCYTISSNESPNYP